MHKTIKNSNYTKGWVIENHGCIFSWKIAPPPTKTKKPTIFCFIIAEFLKTYTPMANLSFN